MKFFRSLSQLLFLIFTLNSGLTAAQTNIYDSLEVDGITRIFRLYIPASYTGNEDLPLVLNLHGYGSNSLEQFLYGNFTSIADTANFIIAMPEGTLDLTGSLSWNNFGLSSIDDIGFISQFIDYLSSQYAIDSDRVYSTGMSNGGFMSYDLACSLGSKIAAIASVTGSMNVLRIADCNPGRAVPIMQIHGTMDGTVPFNGNLAFAPIDSVVEFWRNNNNCNSDGSFEDVPDINMNDNCTAEHYVWDCPISNSSVEFYKIIGGGHSWPGALFNINTTNMDFSASREIWRFFSQYRLSDFTPIGIEEQAKNDKDFRVHPNPSQGIVKISFEDVKQRRIEIMNYSGSLIQAFETKEISETVNLTNSGIYIVKVSDANTVRFRKVVIN
ncbi:MAG: T9SS type A sorting domain-containing protein [Bacteroidia bacterium]